MKLVTKYDTYYIYCDCQFTLTTIIVIPKAIKIMMMMIIIKSGVKLTFARNNPVNIHHDS